MGERITTQNLYRWTRHLRIWLEDKFSHIPTDYAKEQTLTTQSDEIKNKIDNIPAPDLSLVAKQGGNPAATNSAIYEKLDTLPYTQADKAQLAASISAKGVPSSVADSLSQMATKVTNIPQALNTGTSDFDEMLMPSEYEFNVYKIAKDLMETTLPDYFPAYLQSYRAGYGTNAHFVGEYYRGYDTLELTGADGYLTCDGDFYTIAGEMGSRIVTHTLPDGTVETYAAESIIHTWHDADNGKINRYIAFFYLASAWAFTNSTESICPRRAVLCGTCNSFVIATRNRLTDIYVIGTLGHFEGGTSGSSWNPAQVIRNYRVHNSGFIYTSISGVSCIMPELEEINGTPTTSALFKNNGTSEVRLSLSQLYGAIIQGGTGVNVGSNIQRIVISNLKTLNGNILRVENNPGYAFLGSLTELTLNDVEVLNNNIFYMTTYNAANSQGGLANIQRINSPKLTHINASIVSSNNGSSSSGTYEMFRNLIDLTVGELQTNLYMKQWAAYGITSNPTKLAQLNANIRNHIAAKVSDRTGLSALTFTVSTNLYNNLEQATKDAFTAKNWNVAGA